MQAVIFEQSGKAQEVLKIHDMRSVVNSGHQIVHAASRFS
jgi:hypothetical protein